MGTNERVVIIGAGPAGCVVASLLAMRGRAVLMFDVDKRPPLIVGESLLPACVPLLRTLGVEEEVKACSIFKPGASLTCDDDLYPFGFSAAQGQAPSYSYNVPRDQFDAILRGAALRHGAHIERHRATLEPDGEGGVRLAGESLRIAEDFFDAAPDMFVDATGRHALVERTLGLDSDLGTRNDVALFAHLDQACLEEAGHIHVDRLEKGWSWRIPLQGKTSVGVVISRDHLPEYGDTAQEQYDRLLATSPRLAARVEGAKRLTPVVKYTNYQRHAARLHGPNWTLVGDAAGFVDPVFSTGVYLALRGAELAAHAMLSDRLDAREAYQSEWLGELRRWRRIIDHWYDGRLLALLNVGAVMSRAPGGKLVDRHVSKHVTRIFTGEAGARSYSRKLLNFLLPLGRMTQRHYAIS